MTTTSYPSRPVFYLDAPEVENFNVEFVYNFHLPDERTNENATDVPPDLKRKPSFYFDATAQDLELDIVPRYMSLSWSPVHIDLNVPFNGKALNLSPSLQKNTFIRDNKDKIISEEEFTNFGFTGIEFQDTGIDGKMHFLVSGSLAKIAISNNVKIANKVNKQIEFIADQIDTNKLSLMDAAKFLAGELDADDLPNQFIIDALNQIKAAGVFFADDSLIKEAIEKTYENAKRAKTRSRINNNIIEDSITTSATDPLGLFADEVGPLLSETARIQKEAVSKHKPNSIEETEFDLIVEPLRQVIMPKDTVYFPAMRHIGYIIDKYERASDGSLIAKRPIYVERGNVSRTVDFRVAYGTTYVYEIRAIYIVDFQTFSEKDDEITISTVLISSSASPRIVVDAEEFVAPPPPADLNVYWDYSEQAPVVMWSFPVNTQRDIKRFQVFKRKTIDDPFLMQVEYNFDDSIIKTRGFETPDVNLIKNITSPYNFFVDKSFKKNEVWIYTVCSIDAHGMSSNYGMQFEIRFDRFKNNIVKRLISKSGAPKSYPNMLLDEDTFVDTIRDSNHRSMTIYFDPEYLGVVHTGKYGEPFLGSDKNNTFYKMQFINVDFQQSQILDIIIKDLRRIQRRKEPSRSNDGKTLQRQLVKVNP